MDIPVDLLVPVAGVVIAILLIAGVKAARAQLAALREIDGVEDSKPRPAPIKPRPAPAKSAVANTLLSAKNIIVVPGYGMAVAQAQLSLWELAKTLRKEGANVSFAIHPSAGRIPGHINILLDEADVPHDIIIDLDNSNNRFPACNLVLVVGANDIVNPAALTDPDSPIFGMPVLDAGKARQVFAIKRGQGGGFSGTENPLFTADNTRMLYGDAQVVLQNLIAEINAH